MNIPNILTVLRIILVPIYLWVFYTFRKNNIIYSVLILVLAGITDILDGYIARKYDIITKLGTILDPIADKLIIFAILISFTSKNMIPLWILFVIGIKEIVMILGGGYLYCFKNKKIIPANKFGKIATASFYIAIFFVAFNINEVISKLFLNITVFLHLLALINYLIISW